MISHQQKGQNINLLLFEADKIGYYVMAITSLSKVHLLYMLSNKQSNMYMYFKT